MTLRTLCLLFVLVTATGLFASAPEEVAQVRATSHDIRFEPRLAHQAMTLTVSGPEGFYRRFELEAGAFASFDGATLPDGSYTYELRAIPNVLRLRDSDEESSGRPNTRGVQSGSFAVIDGMFFAGGEDERTMNVSANRAIAANDIVVGDDQIVQASICVGLDCVDGETFGFDTLRIKENNNRIQFDDTSNIAGFATNNWQLRANASASGGASFFGIVDQGDTGTSETGTLVFAVAAGAPENALYVDDDGVGFGTAVPAKALHTVSDNTPTLRLEQSAAGGFAAHTWDVGGNEAYFFIRNVSGGNALPFRIFPGAPTNSLVVRSTGNIEVQGSVDGRDIAADGATLDAHVADVSNPHNVTAAQTGADPAGTAAAQVAAHEAAFDHTPDATKAGIASAASFSGNPATATVTFTTPYASSSYAVLLTAITSDGKTLFTPNVISKTVNGFTITLGNNKTTSLVEVSWLARPAGE